LNRFAYFVQQGTKAGTFGYIIHGVWGFSPDYPKLFNLDKVARLDNQYRLFVSKKNVQESNQNKTSDNFKSIQTLISKKRDTMKTSGQDSSEEEELLVGNEQHTDAKVREFNKMLLEHESKEHSGTGIKGQGVGHYLPLYQRFVARAHAKVKEEVRNGGKFQYQKLNAAKGTKQTHYTVRFAIPVGMDQYGDVYVFPN
jgi:hypothetical protein